MKKIIFILIALTLVLSACQSTATEPKADTPSEPVEQEAAVETKSMENNETETMEKVEIIHDTPQEFESNMEGDFLLLDVRTQEEYDEKHIEGSTLIPVQVLESRLSEIEEYKNTRVLVYCRSGNRSVTASNILIDNGFTEVHNLLTGINGWLAYKSE